MRSKNHRDLTVAEAAHIALIKSMPCVVCEAPGPSDAHHIEQEEHFTVLPLCKSCHQSPFNGIHGQARIWKVKKLTELGALAKTVQWLMTGARVQR